MWIDEMARTLGTRRTRRGVMGVALGVAAAAGLAHVAPRAAEAAVSVDLHLMECPADTWHLYETCHPASFPEPAIVQAAGEVVVIADPVMMENYRGLYAYCRDLLTDTVLVDGREDDGQFGFTFDDAVDLQVVCDVYLLTEPTGADQPTDDGDAPELPATGAGSASTGVGLIATAALIAGAAAVAGARQGNRES